uniref:F-box domain-containing protein n=1 Tax=Ditylenchus dipsaci TaxID=166011 RepID=A0A915D5L5_9BILA
MEVGNQADIVSVDVFLDIFSFLNRQELSLLSIVCRQFYILVQNNFSDTPILLIETLNICIEDEKNWPKTSIEFWHKRDQSYNCAPQVLRPKFIRSSSTQINLCAKNKSGLKTLKWLSGRISHVWNNGGELMLTLEVPYKGNDSMDFFSRVFDRLGAPLHERFVLDCYFPQIEISINHPMLNQCEDIHLNIDIINWEEIHSQFLNSHPLKNGRQKKLRVEPVYANGAVNSQSVAKFLTLVKQYFEESPEPCPYFYYMDGYPEHMAVPQNEFIENEITNEQLEIKMKLHRFGGIKQLTVTRWIVGAQEYLSETGHSNKNYRRISRI